MTTKFYNKIILIYIQRRTIINFIIYCSLLFYYILFIDDDDIYIHSEIFQMINNEIDHKKQLIAWKFARPDKIIEPQIKLGHMDTSMFCFHSDWKDKGKWNDQQVLDSAFVAKSITPRFL